MWKPVEPKEETEVKEIKEYATGGEVITVSPTNTIEKILDQHLPGTTAEDIKPKRGRPAAKPKAEPVFSDPVNHPDHYKVGGIETIDFIEAKALGYNLGNVVKYVTRADHKGNRLQDLEKAQWYLSREISRMKDGNV